jgi:hypothetical protein
MTLNRSLIALALVLAFGAGRLTQSDFGAGYIYGLLVGQAASGSSAYARKYTYCWAGLTINCSGPYSRYEADQKEADDKKNYPESLISLGVHQCFDACSLSIGIPNNVEIKRKAVTK